MPRACRRAVVYRPNDSRTKTPSPLILQRAPIEVREARSPRRAATSPSSRGVHNCPALRGTSSLRSCRLVPTRPNAAELRARTPARHQTMPDARARRPTLERLRARSQSIPRRRPSCAPSGAQQAPRAGTIASTAGERQRGRDPGIGEHPGLRPRARRPRTFRALRMLQHDRQTAPRLAPATSRRRPALRQRIGADRAADKVGLVPIVEPEVLMDGEVGDLDDLVEFWRRH
jgi:hypothetical protein